MGDKKKSDDSKAFEQQLQQITAQMSGQIAAAKRATEEAIAAAKKEREALIKKQQEADRKFKIDAENSKARFQREQGEIRLQDILKKNAENQKKLDEQSALKNTQTIAGGSGYSLTPQQQKTSASGGAAGPASTNAPMGISQAVLANNLGAGGTQQPSNFRLPNISGLVFGGI